MGKLRGRHLTMKERLQEMKDYAKQICRNVFDDLEPIHDWTEPEDADVDCVCSYKEYQKIKKKYCE